MKLIVAVKHFIQVFNYSTENQKRSNLKKNTGENCIWG